MTIIDFFKRNKACQHERVSCDVDLAYCPDCGELIQNQWYLLRCGCCGIKLKGIIKNGEIIPEKTFCHNCGTKNYGVNNYGVNNCGANNYVIERIEKINFIDIRFAVLIKSIIKNDLSSYTQSWFESKTSNYRPKLLQEFR